MDVIELIKEKTLWLIGAVLITIPLLACYPILRLLGLPERIASIATVCLTGVAYVLLVTCIKPFLRKILPFIRSKAPDEFSVVVLKRGGTRIQIVKGPNSYLSDSELEVIFSNTNVVRDFRGNWIHS